MMNRILLFIFLFYANFANAVVINQSEVDKLIYGLLFCVLFLLAFIAFIFILKFLFSFVKSRQKNKAEKSKK